METEKCDKCGVEAEKGTLIRDTYDGSQLRCNACIALDKKPRKPRKRKETPMIAAIDMRAFISQYPKEDVPPIDLVALRKDAEAWAKECGLEGAYADEGTREAYPRFGFGYVFQINGKTRSGKNCMGTARYTCFGKRSFWTIDGMVTG